MFKKVIIFNILIVFLFTFINLNYADDEVDNVYINNIDKVVQTASTISEEPKINSKYAVIMERSSKAIIYGKNEKDITKMASTTKIMTALIVIENTNLNNIVEVSKKAAGTGGSKLKLKAGDKISVRDLLYGLMLRSGNDAAVALAEYIEGSIPKFAELMNQKAEELNLKNTHFETPHGLDSDKHYTTAYELAILTDYALNNEVFSNIVNTKTYNITINGYTRTINNTNELLGNLNGVYGVKTGFTNGAGRCLVTSIKRNDLDIICVVLGADTKKLRTIDSVKIIEYVFNNYKNIDINNKIKEEFNTWKSINCGRFNIKKGIKNNIRIELEEYNFKKYPIKNNTQDKVSVQIEANFNLVAPINIGTQIGKVNVFYEEKLVTSIKIVTTESIKKKGIENYLLEITQNYNKYLERVIN